MRHAVAVGIGFAVLLTPATARAHKLNVVAVVSPADPGHVRVEAGYEAGGGGDDPATSANVTITSAAGVVASGATDDRGVCFLARPPAGEYVVAVDDGVGHREAVRLVILPNESEAAEARTGRRNRWLMSAVGLTVVAAGAATARRWLRGRGRSAIMAGPGGVPDAPPVPPR